MGDLHVSLGAAARDALCAAFDGARGSIDAQFHSVDDAAIVGSLNRAAARGVDVTIRVEGDRGRYGHRGEHAPVPAHVRDAAARYLDKFDARVHVVVEGDDLALEHGKAAVVDDARAFVGTANPNADGFAQPGEVLVEDDAPDDVAALRTAIDGELATSPRIVSGPSPNTRPRIAELLAAPTPVRIAMEDLSDPELVRTLITRHEQGLRDEVLVKRERGTNMAPLSSLAASGVAVRALPNAHLHDKYIDAGDRIYIGSANLTRNGLDEAHEIGIIAPARDFGEGAQALRNDFDRMWDSAQSL